MEGFNCGDVVVLKSEVHSLSRTLMTVMNVHDINGYEALDCGYFDSNKNFNRLNDIWASAVVCA